MGRRRSVASHSMGRIPNLAYNGDTQPLHSFAFRCEHPVARGISMTLLALLVFATTLAGAVYADFASVMGSRAIKVISTLQRKRDILPLDHFRGKPINILLLGQDTRSGAENRELGGTEDDGEHNADTTMILQISANRDYMNLVSIPRDTIVSVPECATGRGTVPAATDVMFNSIFATGFQKNGISGAASCTMQAVTHLTGIHLTAFATVDFAGMRSMIDTLGGVDVCVPLDLSDNYTNLRLAKGWRHLNGLQGTQFARVRHGQGVGDGSDIMRTARQQYLIKQLIRQALSKSLLTNTAQLYQFAKAAINSVQLSENLADINTLMGLASSLRHFSVSRVYSRTAPIGPYPADPNRVQFSPEADSLWKLMREGSPINTPLSQGSPTSSQDQGQSQKPSQAAGSQQKGGGSAGAKPRTRAGLTLQRDGTLVDPKTGGTVDPQTGFIKDPNTGQYIGIADTYLNDVVCGVSSGASGK